MGRSWARNVEPLTPQEAKRVVAAYLKVLEAHAEANVYPCSVDELPQSKETVRAAFKTCIAVLGSGGQLTHELRNYLEIAYVSLADYVSGDCMALLREYGLAGEELAGDRRLAREKVGTDAWRRLSEQSRLAGELAREISNDADRLRKEFRSWQSESESGDDSTDISTADA